MLTSNRTGADTATPVCMMVMMCHRFVFHWGYLTGPYHTRACHIWEFWLSKVFALMYLDRLYLQMVTQCGPVRAWWCWWGPVSHDNGHALTDRWLQVLWFAAGRLGDMHLHCVHSAGISRSPAGDRVTASPNSFALLNCGVCSFVLKFWRKADVLWIIVAWIVVPACAFCGSRRCTVNVYITSGVMASGNARVGRPRVDRSGVSFRYELQISWNAPGLTGSDRIGHISRPIHTRFEGALPRRRTDSGAARKGPEQCLCASTGRQSNALGVPWHHACGYDRADRSDSLNGRDEQLGTTVAHISVDRDDTMADWPGGTEAGVQEPVSQFAGRELHVLWTIHYSWHSTPCPQLSPGLGTVVAVPSVMVFSVERDPPPQDCIDHIRVWHHVGISVKTANLGKWFPPWTVTRSAWNTALKTNVSGISTDVVWCSSANMGPSWSTTTRCSEIVFHMVPCAGVTNLIFVLLPIYPLILLCAVFVNTL